MVEPTFSLSLRMAGGGRMSRKLETEILKFVSGLPYWQRYLAAYLLDRIDVEKEDALDEAMSFFLSEHELGEKKQELDLSFPEPQPEGAAEQVQGVKLIAIKGVRNVNAVRPGQTIPVAQNGVTAIGGLNGAGKSSIVRLLNSIFYSRGDNEIFPNVFEAGDGQPPSAVFVFEKRDGAQYELTYVADGKHEHPEFSQFASFDTKCVNVHLNLENELHVAPRGFHFFRELAELTSAILQRVVDAIEKVPVENTFIDQLDGESDAKATIRSLSASTEPQSLDGVLSFSDADEQRGVEIGKEIASLNVASIEARRKDLSEVKKQLTDVENRLSTLRSNLSAESVRAAETALVRLADLKKVAQQQGAERFQGSGIKGVGSEAWKGFVQSAKALAVLQHDHYPSPGDSCLFCSQGLDDAALDQIKGYWDFLNSDAETQLKVFEKSIHSTCTALRALRFTMPDETSALSKWLAANAAGELGLLREHLERQDTLCKTIATSLESQAWTPVETVPVLSLAGLAEKVEKELAAIDTKALTEKKATLEKEALGLGHRKKMASKKTDVLKWIQQQKWAADCQRAKRHISTKGITDTGKRLFDEHVTKKYKQVFHQECTRLNARFRLELTQTGKGGKSHRKYQIEGYPPGKILSEGEQRAVSLADFITELKISGINSGWVFDDPVNSQDIERKDLIAKMLVEEARERQILVFTHDVTFLYDLNAWREELGVPIRFHWVERQGLDAGIIHADVPPNFEQGYVDPERAEKKLVEAKQPTLDPMERENRLKEGFSCLRTSYEAFVIQKMLAKTVVRFDRRLGYDSLENIYAPPVWKKRVARKLKKLSAFIEGHSHSDMGRKPLTTQMLEDEIAEFKQMKKEFSAEAKAALQEEARTDGLLPVANRTPSLPTCREAGVPVPAIG